MKTKHLQQQHWRKSNQWFLLIRKHAQVRLDMGSNTCCGVMDGVCNAANFT
jgi:hypothetical protein